MRSVMGTRVLRTASWVLACVFLAAGCGNEGAKKEYDRTCAGPGVARANVYVYDIDADEWSEVPPSPVSPGWATAVLGNDLYATDTYQFIRGNLETGEWESLPLPEVREWSHHDLAADARKVYSYGKTG